MKIDFCPFCQERFTLTNPEAPSGEWEARAHEACLTAAGVKPVPKEVARLLRAGHSSLGMFPWQLLDGLDRDTIEKVRVGDVPLGDDLAATLIATCLLQTITYSIERLPNGTGKPGDQGGDSIVKDLIEQFTAMLPVLRGADERLLGIALAMACDRFAKRRDWKWWAEDEM